jgi:hypothetical protein
MTIKSHHLQDFNPDSVIASILLPTLAQASVLESNYRNFLIDPKPGLYIPGQPDPVIVPTGQYYTTFSVGLRQDLVKINTADLLNFNLSTAIYSSAGQLLLSETVMRKAKDFLSLAPTMPVRGVLVTKAVIDNCLMRWAPWARTDHTERNILKHFRGNVTPQNVVDDLERFLNNTIHTLSHFVGDDVWNCYSVKLIGFDICVEKGQDYRVIEWYQKKLNGEWT